MAEDQKNDKDVLGEEWGSLAGHTHEDGLKIIFGMQSELAAENQRLRAAAAQPTPTPPEPEKTPPESRRVDLDVIRGEDPEKAAEELNRYTSEVVGDVVKEEFAARDKLDFPTKRQQAKAAAAEIIRQAGGDFSKREQEIDKFMTEQYHVDRQAQANPNNWAQAFTTLEGLQAMSGTETVKTGAPHVERPTPNSPQARNKPVLTAIESEVRDNFARVAGEQISDEEFAFFRDTGEGDGDAKMNVGDYEQYVIKQAERQKRRR